MESVFSSPALGQVSFCHHFASMARSRLCRNNQTSNTNTSNRPGAGCRLNLTKFDPEIAVNLQFPNVVLFWLKKKNVFRKIVRESYYFVGVVSLWIYLWLWSAVLLEFDKVRSRDCCKSSGTHPTNLIRRKHFIICSLYHFIRPISHRKRLLHVETKAELSHTFRRSCAKMN
jgi:hypothetical protein